MILHGVGDVLYLNQTEYNATLVLHELMKVVLKKKGKRVAPKGFGVQELYKIHLDNHNDTRGRWVKNRTFINFILNGYYYYVQIEPTTTGSIYCQKIKLKGGLLYQGDYFTGTVQERKEVLKGIDQHDFDYTKAAHRLFDVIIAREQSKRIPKSFAMRYMEDPKEKTTHLEIVK